MAGAGPLTIGVTELLRHPGTRREIHREVELEELRVSRSVVHAGALCAIDVTVEAMVGEAISVHGVVAVDWTGECRRCLESVPGRLNAEVTEIFEVHPTEGETYPIEGEAIDLEPLVRDAILLSLPISPLCREDCLGPDPEAYPVTKEGQRPTGDDLLGEPTEPSERDRPRDPRWAALDVLLEGRGPGSGAGSGASAHPD
jgi:uncharacterized protein